MQDLAGQQRNGIIVKVLAAHREAQSSKPYTSTLYWKNIMKCPTVTSSLPPVVWLFGWFFGGGKYMMLDKPTAWNQHLSIMFQRSLSASISCIPRCWSTPWPCSRGSFSNKGTTQEFTEDFHTLSPILRDEKNTRNSTKTPCLCGLFWHCWFNIILTSVISSLAFRFHTHC